MICTRCGAGESRLHNIGNKNHYKHGNYRTYVCDACDHRYQTIQTNVANNKMVCEKCGGEEKNFYRMRNAKRYTDAANFRDYLCAGCGNIIITIEQHIASLDTIKPARDYFVVRQKLIA